MKSKRILFVSQAITPYLPEDQISRIGRYLPQGIQEKGKEIRTFMPRFGCINERRNQLHEVIRLSGMNLIIDDTDHPLIIKVASIQAARMQVYFIDNEDYFHRKFEYADDEGKEFADNDERLIFFARGVLETVKKLRWPPHIIHCHGWFTSLIPLYVRKSYRDDPIFSDSRVIYSVYDRSFRQPLDPFFTRKLSYEGIEPGDLKHVEKKADFTGLNKLAIEMSDAVIQGSETIDPVLLSFIKKSGKKFLDFQPEEKYIDVYSDFYDELLSQKIHDSK
ncbi:MAG: glycogen/starch synthase [Bacteroidales bacterium]